jgi:hypothetical protein
LRSGKRLLGVVDPVLMAGCGWLKWMKTMLRVKRRRWDAPSGKAAKKF